MIMEVVVLGIRERGVDRRVARELLLKASQDLRRPCSSVDAASRRGDDDQGITESGK